MTHGMIDILAAYGLDPFKVCVAIISLLLGLSVFKAPTDDDPTAKVPKIELHPDHLHYMKEKEKEHCGGRFGKGMRCIIEYLREEEDGMVKKIFSETPKYTEGFEVVDIDIYQQQFAWFAEKGILVSEVEGEEYRELSKATRAFFDWAMRQEAEGNNQDYTLFEYHRCLNC